ncbi:Dos2-interacting transcription regulator of RNA-Pol-II-domain-containing protein [Mycena sanguinolenta]|nr:Dos2-interacting transcription regulator of RNA-Pol-II-domain-containing protein [Mycena sanguinolenta]
MEKSLQLWQAGLACFKTRLFLISCFLEVSQGRLLGVVKALGTYLTSEQDDLRTKGVDFLATIITRCPENTLNRQSVKVLTAFFCGKLDDTETIEPALKGLASLPAVCSSSDALVMIKAQVSRLHLELFPAKTSFSVFGHIFQPTDSATEEVALTTMQALVVTIHAEDDTQQDADLQGLARDACEECVTILREPEKSQAKPAIKVLCAFMMTTPSVARYTPAHAVPHLLKLFADPNETSSPLYERGIRFYVGRCSRVASRAVQRRGPWRAHFGCRDPHYRPRRTRGSDRARVDPHLLSDEELGFVVPKVNDVLEKCLDEEHSDDRNAILKLLMTISERSPTHVRDQTFPILLTSLPARAPQWDAVSVRARYQHVLSTLCGPPSLFEALVAALTPRLVSLAFDGVPDGDLELPAAYLHALLAAVKRTLAGKVDERHADVAAYADSLVPSCGAAGPSRRREPLSWTMGWATNESRQKAASFCGGAVSSLPCRENRSAEHVLAEERFFPLTAEATTTERNLLVLFEAGVIPLHPSVTIDTDINACTEAILVQGLAHADTLPQAEAVLHISTTRRCTGPLRSSTVPMRRPNGGGKRSASGLNNESGTQAVLAEHAPPLVRQLLAYTNDTNTHAPRTSARVLIPTLRLLRALPSVVRYAVLHPYKADALGGLARALDDPRKEVRREAVDAREVCTPDKGGRGGSSTPYILANTVANV